MSRPFIAVIGGGAAGSMAAIEIKRRLPHARVAVYEAGRRLLAKVSVTGGGRCNLTNSFSGVSSMEQVYPRGARLMKRLFRQFSHTDAYAWFEREGVQLVTQDDQCVFPRSQNAMEIVDTLMGLLRRLDVEIATGCRMDGLMPVSGGGYRIHFAAGTEVLADVVVVTTGGSPKDAGLDMFRRLSLAVEPPVPSLFSLCLPGHPLTGLMGTVVADTAVSIPGTRYRACGPLLVTHWGLSGPAMLKLSSHAARLLHERAYRTPVIVNWMGGVSEEAVADELSRLAASHPHKLVHSIFPPCFNSRLWAYFLQQARIAPETRWNGLDRKSLNRLVALLTGQQLQVDGKNRFKEEFVTCGGVALSNVDSSTLECRRLPGLYFAGEVLDVDAVTGGFNLQAAWTMGYVVGRSVGERG